MKEVGGYFGLELAKGNNRYHTTAYQLKSGRASLNFLLTQQKPAKVYLPFYTCNALLEPFLLQRIPICFYAIDKHFQIVELPRLKGNELILYINYYDLKGDYVEQLSKHYGAKLIVDCTQSYFLKGNGHSFFFTSSRKFFGVPDGSDLYLPNDLDYQMQYQGLAPNTNYMVQHLVNRFNGFTQEGYSFFTQNEILNDSTLLKISLLSETLLSQVDFDATCERRQRNFVYLQSRLGEYNLLQWQGVGSAVSNFYPLLPHRLIDKKLFWAEKIFIPALWNDCVNRNDDAFAWERELSQKLLPIPIDHRYDDDDLERVVAQIKKYIDHTTLS